MFDLALSLTYFPQFRVGLRVEDDRMKLFKDKGMINTLCGTRTMKRFI